MALKIGRFDTDGDWTNTANWVGGVLPVNTDDVVIDASRYDLDTNLNRSSLDLNSFSVTSRFRRKIGSAGAALQLGAVTVSVNYAGLGSVANLSISTVPMAKLHVATSLYISGGTWTDVEVTGGGTLDVAAAVLFANGASGVARFQGPRTTIGANATAINRVHVDSGQVSTRRSVATIDVYGSGADLVTLGTAAVTTGGVIARGGRLSYRSSGGLNSTNAIEVKPGGTLSPDGNSNASIYEASPAGAAFQVKANVWRGGSLVETAGAFKFNKSNIRYIGEAAVESATGVEGV